VNALDDADDLRHVHSPTAPAYALLALDTVEKGLLGGCLTALAGSQRREADPYFLQSLGSPLGSCDPTQREGKREHVDAADVR